jgi:hypothetical protein
VPISAAAFGFLALVSGLQDQTHPASHGDPGSPDDGDSR